MSKQLLLTLNGNRNGELKRWLDNFQGEPRIAWYPSAGEDFRDLLYLNPEFTKLEPGAGPDPAPPDIFLHTDYFPWDDSTFLDTPVHLDDGRTKITVRYIEELPRCDLPLDEESARLPKGSIATGRVVFLQVEVSSGVLGDFTAPMIYAFVENQAFCAERILPLRATFSHVIHVRYGLGFRGKYASGAWLLEKLSSFQCECFITDDRYGSVNGDTRIYRLYPSLTSIEPSHLAREYDMIPLHDREYHLPTTPDRSVLHRVIRRLRGIRWYNHGDVTWYGVHPAH